MNFFSNFRYLSKSKTYPLGTLGCLGINGGDVNIIFVRFFNKANVHKANFKADEIQVLPPLKIDIIGIIYNS